MTSYLFVILGAVLVNNVVLVRILGLCPFMGVSKKLGHGHRHGCGHHLRAHRRLRHQLSWWTTGCSSRTQLDYLRTLSFIVIIAAIVQFTELVIQKTSPFLHQVLGIYLPLITTNCAVLGVPLLNVGLRHDLLESLLFGFGSSVGFTSPWSCLPASASAWTAPTCRCTFKGTAIAMVTAGLMSLAFMGFAGLDKYRVMSMLTASSSWPASPSCSVRRWALPR
jgi:electron transport complex protein RnfA